MASDENPLERGRILVDLSARDNARSASSENNPPNVQVATLGSVRNRTNDSLVDDDKKADDVVSKSEIRELLLCPISHDIVEDPVQLFQSGQTYDRQSLCQSLLRYPRLDPLTGQEYDPPLLYSSNTLARRLLMKTFGDEVYVPWDDSCFRKLYRAAIASPAFRPPPVDNSILTLTGHTSEVCCCVVFANGRKALSGGRDCTLRVWYLVTGDLLQTLTGHTDLVSYCAVFDRDRKALSGANDTTLRVWNLETAMTIRIFSGHIGPVSGSAVFDNGQQAIAVTGADDADVVRVWDLDTGDTLRTFAGSGPDWMTCCTVFDDGQKAISGYESGTLLVWDLITCKTLFTLTDDTLSLSCVNCCEVFDNGRKAVSFSCDDTFRVWNITTGELLRTLSRNLDSNSVAFFDNDRKLLVCGYNDLSPHVLDLATGETIQTLTGHISVVHCCTLFEDENGRKALTGSEDNTLRVWELTDDDEEENLTDDEEAEPMG